MKSRISIYSTKIGKISDLSTSKLCSAICDEISIRFSSTGATTIEWAIFQTIQNRAMTEEDYW